MPKRKGSVCCGGAQEGISDSFLDSRLAQSHLTSDGTAEEKVLELRHRGSATFEDAGREAAKLPPRHATWGRTAFLLIADIVGVGILELGHKFVALGWVLGLTFMVAFFCVNYYTGILLSKLRDSYPNAVSLGDLAGYIFQTPRAALCVGDGLLESHV